MNATRSPEVDQLLESADRLIRSGEYLAADQHYRQAERLVPGDASIALRRALLHYRIAAGSQNAFYKALPACRDAIDRADAATRPHLRDLVLDDAFFKPLAEALFGSQ